MKAIHALAAAAVLIFAGGAIAANPAKVAKPGKADKTARVSKAESPVPLAAQLLKVDGQRLTVMTKALMGPDGVIPGKEKTYDLAADAVVQLNGEKKPLADLPVHSLIHLALSDDGKTATRVEAKVVTAADRAMKKAARAEAADKAAAPETK
jgi:hypothetical protein